MQHNPFIPPKDEPHTCSSLYRDTSWELNYPNLLQAFFFKFQTFEEAKALAAYLTEFFPSTHRNFTELGINEIFINAIEHGNLGITYEEKAALKLSDQWEKVIYRKLRSPTYQKKSVKVFLEMTPDFIALNVQDEGEGFNWRQAQEKFYTPKAYHNKGLLMAKSLCFHSIEFLGKGNCVRCITYL